MADSLQADLSALAGRRIFFGHQSVGEDILEGIRLLSKQSSIDFPIVEVVGGRPETRSAFLHAKVGRNGDPASKCRGFGEMLNALKDAPPEAALFKFCYVDITGGSDPAAVLAEYRAAMEALKQAHPGVRLLHSTVPLTAGSGGLRLRLKRLLGRRDWTDADNAARGRYNRALREAFGSGDLVDIAEAESTLEGGARASFSHDGTEHFSLVRAYTHDGGHLNEQGKRRVAAAFVRTLAAALGRKPA